MSRIIHFDVHADEPDRAIAFYKKTLGWSFQKWDGPMEYWLITTGPDSEPGINGGLMKRQDPDTSEGDHGYLCTVGVDKLDETLTKVQTAGGTLFMPKGPIPGVGWFALIRDTEGNSVGLMQDDPKAGL